MILYLDACALVKRYIAEAGSEQVNTWIASADLARDDGSAGDTRNVRQAINPGCQRDKSKFSSSTGSDR